MTKIAFAVTAFLLLLPFLVGLPPAAQAADKPNILIVGDDADVDSVPRHSRIFKRVLDAIAGELHLEGFDVFDEVAITAEDFAQGRSRRSDAEVIDIAKSSTRPPIDIVVVFSIYASADELKYTTKVNARITGRLLNTKSGQRLGNFEVESPRNWVAPADCPRECILEIVGKYSRNLAKDLGAVLAIKLADIVEAGAVGTDDTAAKAAVDIGDAYTLVLSGFTPEEVMDIEEYLVVFTGYKTHRPIYSGTRHHELWYETTSKSSRLVRNLNKMLKHLAIRGRVTFAGSELTVTKIARRKKRLIDQDDY